MVDQTLAAIARHRLDLWVYTDLDWLVKDAQAPHVAREEQAVRFRPKLIADHPGRLQRVAKIVGVSDDLEAMAACEADLRQTCGQDASITRSQSYYLDVTHPEANKGTAVTTLAEMLAIPAGHIATIGDMPTDVLMFQKKRTQHRHGQR